ncbi:hypothetical protein Landi51_09351 [Colletotrichum acutatum]
MRKSTATFWFTIYAPAMILILGTSRLMGMMSRLLQGSGGQGQPGLRKRMPCVGWLVPFLWSRILNATLRQWMRLSTRRISSSGIKDTGLDGIAHFTSHIQRLYVAGARFTGSEEHENYVKWLEGELKRLPGLEVSSSHVSVLAWQPKGSLAESVSLTLTKDHDQGCPVEIQVAGAVPYSLPTSGRQGHLIYVPRSQKISGNEVKGKMILRDFPARPVPYSLGLIPSYFATRDLEGDLMNFYDRPGFADEVIHQDLLDAGEAQVAGVFFLFDIPRDQVLSYFEPHKGTHYEVPAAYLGIEESMALRRAASDVTTKFYATLQIKAYIAKKTARSLTATLPGQIAERIIYVTHTDGNTCVQENGPVALLALARYFTQCPLWSRKRTIQFAFNVGHLHISREGSLVHAKELDASFDDSNDPTTLVVPIEHLGTREIEAVHHPHEFGRRLCHTGRGEAMFWCVGPSPPVVQAVIDAVMRRELDRVIVTRGVSTPNLYKTPTFTSFGGIGTYYHNLLLPTTSLISGPWSLWAPSFGPDSIDVFRLRQQTLALGDVYVQLEKASREEIVSGYETCRKTRALSGSSYIFEEPPEQASDAKSLVGNVIKY